MKLPLRLVWSMVGRSLILDATGKEVLRPSRDIGNDFDGQEWEKDAKAVVEAVNNEWRGKP